MDFDLRRPCKTCPFLREGGVRLTRTRAQQIAGLMTSPDGGTFECHKTGRDTGVQSQHCAGALGYALNHDNMTQMMRIAARLGWDPDTVEGRDELIDGPAEMEMPRR